MRGLTRRRNAECGTEKRRRAGHRGETRDCGTEKRCGAGHRAKTRDCGTEKRCGAAGQKRSVKPDRGDKKRVSLSRLFSAFDGINLILPVPVFSFLFPIVPAAPLFSHLHSDFSVCSLFSHLRSDFPVCPFIFYLYFFPSAPLLKIAMIRSTTAGTRRTRMLTRIPVYSAIVPMIEGVMMEPKPDRVTKIPIARG